jgi:hypothetical protein
VEDGCQCRLKNDNTSKSRICPVSLDSPYGDIITENIYVRYLPLLTYVNWNALAVICILNFKALDAKDDRFSGKKINSNN